MRSLIKADILRVFQIDGYYELYKAPRTNSTLNFSNDSHVFDLTAWKIAK